MEPIKVQYWHEYIKEHPTFTGCLINKINNKAWYKNGKRHREDGPAVEWGDVTKAWYKNEKYHREDGPAVELANGDKYWYLNGKCYSEQEWLIAMRKIKIEKVLNQIEEQNEKSM